MRLTYQSLQEAGVLKESPECNGVVRRQDAEAEALVHERLGLPWRWVLLGVVLSGVASLAASQWHHQPAYSAAWSAQSHALLERMSALGDQLAHQRCAAARLCA